MYTYISPSAVRVFSSKAGRDFMAAPAGDRVS